LILTGLLHLNTPIASAALVAAAPDLVFSAIQNTTSAPRTIVFTNTGPGSLTITGRTITGTNAGNFAITAPGAGAVVVPVGGTITYTLTFSPPNGVFNVERTATLTLNTSAGTVPVNLHGLALQGSAGSNEPPLQLAIRVAGFNINVGSNALISRPVQPAPIFEDYTLGDEVFEPLFQKAGPGNVTMTSIMRFSPAEDLPYGYYFPNGTLNPPLNEVNSMADTTGAAPLNHQRLYPITTTNNNTFDPGNNAFGLYVSSLSFARDSFTEEALNTGPRVRAARMFPARNRSGTLIPNSYIVTYEDAANGDYQDYVFLVENVVPAQIDPPIAANDTAATTVPAAVNINVLANDVGVDAPLNINSVAIVTAPPAAQGTVVVNANGTITFTPNVAFAGVSTFTYTVRDNLGTISNVATVQVTVTAPVPPVAANDTATITAPNPVTIPVLANDTGVAAPLNPASVAIVTAPPAAQGTVVVNVDGTITFTPNAAFGGVSTFTYTVRDTAGTISNVATVQVTVNQPIPPLAQDDTGATIIPNPLTLAILANDVDGDGAIDPATLTIVTPPPAGQGTVVINPDNTITFTPDIAYIGITTFTYTVRDVNGIISNVATVQITTDPAAPPIAANDVATTTSPNPVTINLVGNDTGVAAPLDAASVTLMAAPPMGQGNVMVNGDGTAQFTPETAFTGTSTFTYTVDDTLGTTSNVATVTVDVAAPPVVNNPPPANDNQSNQAAATTPTVTANSPTAVQDATARVSLAYTASQGFIAPGNTVQLVINLTNNGGTLRRLALENFLPSDLEIVSVTASSGTATAAGQLVTMQLSELATGQSIVITITVRGRGNVTTPFITTEACAGAENLARLCASTILSRVTTLPDTGETPAWRLPVIIGIGMFVLVGLASVRWSINF
jgi:hypothetical protein